MMPAFEHLLPATAAGYPPRDILASVVAASVYFAAGSWMFMFLFGRLLLGLEVRPGKKSFNFIVMLLMTLVPAAFGFITGYTRWLFLPCLVLTGAILVHVRQDLIRRRHRSFGPVESDAAKMSLLKPVTTCDLACKRYELTGPYWTEKPFRVVVLSDFHVHDGLLDYYSSIMDRAQSLAPDVLFLAGDFISNRSHVGILSGVLAKASSRYGTFAVLGNHDIWEDAAGVSNAITGAGIRHLQNTSHRIHVTDSFSVLISGCESPWNTAKWEPPERRAGEPLLVLTHTADNIYHLSRHGADAVFAGHYHGGQAALPWLGSVIVPSRYGRRFDKGHFLVGDTHLFVTSGVGVASPTFRIFCHPDILVVDFSIDAKSG